MMLSLPFSGGAIVGVISEGQSVSGLSAEAVIQLVRTHLWGLRCFGSRIDLSSRRLVDPKIL